jgi:hypothetical protein
MKHRNMPSSGRKPAQADRASARDIVIPAKAGTHFDVCFRARRENQDGFQLSLE